MHADSVNMAEHKITLEEQQQQQQQQQPAVSLAKSRFDWHLRRRHSLHRLSQKQLGLLLLLGCLALILLYVYWDIMMLFTLGGILNARRGLQEPLAMRLEREVRVACVVMTSPEHHKSRAVHIQRTWGKRCNRIYFMSTALDDELETIVQQQPEQYDALWGRTREAFVYLYEQKREEADWFLKADDDTYVFVENLRYMLYPYSPEMPIHFGFKYKLMDSQQKNASFMSDGSGYVLSREALRRFVQGLNESSKCLQQDDSAADVQAGRCLFNLHILAGDSRDSRLRNRFFPLPPHFQLLSNYTRSDYPIHKHAYYYSRACLDCLSNYPVAFHYISPEELYVYDYYSYRHNLYGRQSELEHLPPKIAPHKLYIPPSDN